MWWICIILYLICNQHKVTGKGFKCWAVSDVVFALIAIDQGAGNTSFSNHLHFKPKCCCWFLKVKIVSGDEIKITVHNCMNFLISDRNSFFGGENYPVKTVKVQSLNIVKCWGLLKLWAILSGFDQPLTVLQSCVDCTNLLCWQATAFWKQLIV